MNALGLNVARLGVLAAVFVAAPASALTLQGLSGPPHSVTAEEFAKAPHSTITFTRRGETHSFEGVEMLELFRLVGGPWGETLTGKDLRDVALAISGDGYEVAYSIGEIDPGTAHGHVIVADKEDGKPLGARAGPYQVVVEADDRPARSARMVETLKLIRLP